jgi:hypothetical protein
MLGVCPAMGSDEAMNEHDCRTLVDCWLDDKNKKKGKKDQEEEKKILLDTARNICYTYVKWMYENGFQIESTLSYEDWLEQSANFFDRSAGTGRKDCD